MTRTQETIIGILAVILACVLGILAAVLIQEIIQEILISTLDGIPRRESVSMTLRCIIWAGCLHAGAGHR